KPIRGADREPGNEFWRPAAGGVSEAGGAGCSGEAGGAGQWIGRLSDEGGKFQGGARGGQLRTVPLAAEALQLGEGAIVGALGGIDAPLEAGEALIGAAVDIGEGSLFIEGGEREFAGLCHLV